MKERFWYVDMLKRIGIVEKGTNSVTKDGYTSDYSSISEEKDMRIYAISRDFDVLIDEPGNTFLRIPEQYHEVIVYKAIASGYKDPRNQDIQVAQYFDNEYNMGVKEAKNFSKSNYQTIGRVSPQEY